MTELPIVADTGRQARIESLPEALKQVLCVEEWFYTGGRIMFVCLKMHGQLPCERKTFLAKKKTTTTRHGRREWSGVKCVSDMLEFRIYLLA